MALNDLGSYRECLATPNSTYYLITVDAKMIELYFGLCVPNECRLDEYPTVNAFIAQSLYEASPPGTMPALTAADVQIY